MVARSAVTSFVGWGGFGEHSPPTRLQEGAPAFIGCPLCTEPLTGITRQRQGWGEQAGWGVPWCGRGGGAILVSGRISPSRHGAWTGSFTPTSQGRLGLQWYVARPRPLGPKLQDPALLVSTDFLLASRYSSQNPLPSRCICWLKPPPLPLFLEVGWGGGEGTVAWEPCAPGPCDLVLPSPLGGPLVRRLCPALGGGRGQRPKPHPLGAHLDRGRAGNSGRTC